MARPAGERRTSGPAKGKVQRLGQHAYADSAVVGSVVAQNALLQLQGLHGRVLPGAMRNRWWTSPTGICAVASAVGGYELMGLRTRGPCPILRTLACTAPYTTSSSHLLHYLPHHHTLPVPRPTAASWPVCKSSHARTSPPTKRTACMQQRTPDPTTASAFLPRAPRATPKHLP